MNGIRSIINIVHYNSGTVITTTDDKTKVIDYNVSYEKDNKTYYSYDRVTYTYYHGDWVLQNIYTHDHLSFNFKVSAWRVKSNEH